MELIQKLNWRYAAKRMNGSKVPAQKLDNILESIRLSASSAGMQPYQVIVVEDPEMKEKLRAAAFDQPQITEASHILVFAAWEEVTVEKVDEYISRIALARSVTTESLDGFRNNLLGLAAQPSEANFTWASRQAYIPLGTALVAAAFEAVDATPMEGFAGDTFDALLGLQEKGLKSVVILALGYRDETNDWLAPLKKVRRSKEDLFAFV